MVDQSQASNRPYGIAPPGFRLPDEAHVGAVHLQVSDLSRSVSYYEHVIGLRTLSSTSDSAVLGPHGDDRPLVRLQTLAGVVPARRGAFGLYHFAILLPDRAALGRFATHVSARGVPVGMADHLVSEAIYLWDPDGLGIEVYADRPRSTWQHHGREIAMTTDPLDVRSLIATAAGQPWDGAPPGTVMGHVHLHVGALDTAEAFYHRALGFDKTVWSYPGALFLSAGGYHHHLGTNVWSPGPSPLDNHAQLLAWEIVLPNEDDLSAARQSLLGAGHVADDASGGFTAADPWGTRVHVLFRPAAASSPPHGAR
jgi:catechol 2,3-dioxygenase